jgi:hypothetical protein
MGKQTNIKLRGTVENVIYYQWKGIHCMRTVPEKVRQTRNTRKAASVFGMAVKSAAAMRTMLRPVLPDPASRPMMYALDAAVRKWLQLGPLKQTEPVDKIPSFEHLSFNKEAYPGKVFREVSVSRKNNNDLLVKMPGIDPAADITAPVGTVKVGITFIAALLPFTGELEQKAEAAEIFLPYNNNKTDPQEVLLPAVTGLHCLTLAVMSTRFYKSMNECLPINQKRWKAAVIVGSFYN